ncbi:tetratricopeptide repeat protein [Oscillatoria salina]|uniref:tetratricopeptide repeat protein n=1 Tax=Oscillatoria salina TaxID=331517 RepID=UPI0013BAFEC0|nr:tetratricopeptide repeat protein [Oscillatoria salina]MBZ8179343.1 tetratricopeptide repeat protein [Oscillatoria salina IIICB1]NET91212.1 tetratricopeptide repeat protein [Kamptonema sp. SIO1D9]
MKTNFRILGISTIVSFLAIATSVVSNFQVRLLAQEIAQPENNFEYWAQSCSESNNPTEAIAACDRALSFENIDDESLALTWYNRAVILSSLGRFNEAVESYHQVIKINPDRADLMSRTWYNNGIMFMQLGRYQEAVSSFDEALKIFPDFDLARQKRNSALIYLRN